jgi:23S rRNA pseudouridine2605 synthase
LRGKREGESRANEGGRGKGEDGSVERLQKLLSMAGVASRRLSEDLIRQGRVTVNGSVVTQLGTKANLERDEVRVDGRRVRARQRMRYILPNKPRGYVTTRRDPQGRPTVMDLLKSVHEYIYPVGRLDYDSEGLLLLTNDGELAAQLTHPRHEVERVYEARIRGVPDAHALDRLARGVVIEGRRTAPARVELVESREDQSVVEIALHEGRQRQVRNMFEAVAHPVIRLRRVRLGPIADENLTTGYWRELTPAEVARLRRAVRQG